MFSLLSILFCLSARATTPPNLDALAAKLMRMDASSVRINDEPEFQFFKLENDTWLIGLKQVFRVHTSVNKMSAFLGNPKAYIGILNGVKEARLVDRKSKNKFSIYTETALPIPFMKPDQTTMHYELKRQASKLLYKISLVSSHSLISYSGILFIAPLKGGNCLVYRLDFFEPSLGIVKILGQEKIWSESAVTALQADRAIKLRLEHPDWSVKKVNEMSNDNLDASRASYRELYASRETFALPSALPQLVVKKTKVAKKKS